MGICKHKKCLTGGQTKIVLQSNTHTQKPTTSFALNGKKSLANEIFGHASLYIC